MQLNIQKIQTEWPAKVTTIHMAKNWRTYIGSFLATICILLILASFKFFVNGEEVSGIFTHLFIVGVLLLGLRLVNRAYQYSKPPEEMPFIKYGQGILNDIQNNNWADPTSSHVEECSKYELRDLLDIFHHITREKHVERFGAICHLLQSRMA